MLCKGIALPCPHMPCRDEPPFTITNRWPRYTQCPMIWEWFHIWPYWSKNPLLTLGSEVFAGYSGPHPDFVLLILWSVWEEELRWTGSVGFLRWASRYSRGCRMSLVHRQPFGAQFKLEFLARSSRLGVSCRTGFRLIGTLQKDWTASGCTGVGWTWTGAVGFLVSFLMRSWTTRAAIFFRLLDHITRQEVSRSVEKRRE